MSDIKYTAFKTKIYPTKEQEEYFNKCFGVTRFAYNWYVENKNDCLKNGIKKSFYDLRKEFNNNRNNYNFVLEVNSRVYGSALANVQQAFENHFKYKREEPSSNQEKIPNSHSLLKDVKC